MKFKPGEMLRTTGDGSRDRAFGRSSQRSEAAERKNRPSSSIAASGV
jgi:hypothetical protein